MIRSTGRPGRLPQAVGVQPGLELVAAEPLARLCAGRDVVGLPVDDLQAGERRDHEVDEPLDHDPVARERERHLPQRARAPSAPVRPPRTPGRRGPAAPPRPPDPAPPRPPPGRPRRPRSRRRRRRAPGSAATRAPPARPACRRGRGTTARHPSARRGSPASAAIAVALVYRTRRAPGDEGRTGRLVRVGGGGVRRFDDQVGEGRCGDAARQGGRIPLDGRRGRARVEEAAGPALARVARGVPERHDQVVAGAGGAHVQQAGRLGPLVPLLAAGGAGDVADAEARVLPPDHHHDVARWAGRDRRRPRVGRVRPDPGQDRDRELEALRGVDGEDADGVLVVVEPRAVAIEDRPGRALLQPRHERAQPLGRGRPRTPAPARPRSGPAGRRRGSRRRRGRPRPSCRSATKRSTSRGERPVVALVVVRPEGQERLRHAVGPPVERGGQVVEAQAPVAGARRARRPSTRTPCSGGRRRPPPRRTGRRSP